MTTGERIRKRRKELEISAEDLGAEIGVDRSTVYRYENGDIEKLPISVLEPISVALRTTVEYLMGWTDDPTDYDDGDLIANIPQDMIDYFDGDVKKAYGAWIARTTPDEDSFLPRGIFRPTMKKVPLLGKVACGRPLYSPNFDDGYALINSDTIADFALEAQGDSMIGAHIDSGDIVFLIETEMVDSGEIAAVFIDDEVTLKRVYYQREKNKLTLVSENPKYPPLVFVGHELDSVRIIGKAIAYQHVFKQ